MHDYTRGDDPIYDGFRENWVKEDDTSDTSVLRSPCDLCRFDPPSSLDGKPCMKCPASPKR